MGIGALVCHPAGRFLHLGLVRQINTYKSRSLISIYIIDKRYKIASSDLCHFPLILNFLRNVRLKFMLPQHWMYGLI
jgi:hypothetical protein